LTVVPGEEGLPFSGIEGNIRHGWSSAGPTQGEHPGAPVVSSGGAGSIEGGPCRRATWYGSGNRSMRRGLAKGL
jgi:hypothetical protein